MVLDLVQKYGMWYFVLAFPYFEILLNTLACAHIDSIGEFVTGNFTAF